MKRIRQGESACELMIRVICLTPKPPITNAIGQGTDIMPKEIVAKTIPPPSSKVARLVMAQYETLAKAVVDQRFVRTKVAIPDMGSRFDTIDP